MLVGLEDYDAAIEQFEELESRGTVFPATYETLARAYQARGDVARARAVLEEFNERNPDDWMTLARTNFSKASSRSRWATLRQRFPI